MDLSPDGRYVVCLSQEIDVHKRMLAVVVADVAVEGEYQFERRTIGTSPDQLRALAAWLTERDSRG